MKKDRYKIVVLSDLTKSPGAILQSAVSLAQIINAQIVLFSVKKPTDIVKMDNQLSARRTINSEHKATDRKMQNLIAPMVREYGVNITYSFAFGNVKTEIETLLSDQNPDVVVLGKRRSSAFSLIGDGITDFVLNRHKGPIMIASRGNALEPKKEIGLGTLNNPKAFKDLEFSEELLQQARPPLKVFNIIKNAAKSQKHSPTSNQKIVEYVFEYNDNIIKNFSTYLSKNQIDLLCMDRANKQSQTEGQLTLSDVKEVMGKLKVSLLISGE